MDIFFMDDSGQERPSRSGMGPVVSIGGMLVPEESMSDLESKLDEICKEYGFPSGEMFKWSPSRDLWMYSNLVEDGRRAFFVQILHEARRCECTATVVLEDKASRTATQAETPELDVLCLCLERIHHQLNSKDRFGIVIVSQPSGGRGDERGFLLNCLHTLREGTEYVMPNRIILNVISSPPRFIRMLQLADVIVSCTTSFISGETPYSEPIFNEIRPVLPISCQGVAELV